MDTKIIDSNTYSFILNNVKLINNSIEEELLKFYIDKAVQDIVIKTNRNKFPEDLRYLIIDLVNDIFSIAQADTNPSEIQNIQSMSEDGRSVNFGISEYNKSKLSLLLQQKIEDNKTLINRYKLLYKVKAVENNAN